MHASFGLLVAAFATTAVATVAVPAAAQGGPAPAIQLLGKRSTAIVTYEVGDTLAVQVDGMVPRMVYDLQLVDDLGAQLGLARATANLDGVIEPEVLWWESGVTGLDPDGRGNGGWGFADFATAESYLAGSTPGGRTLTVEVRQADPLNFGAGRLITSLAVPRLAQRQSPNFWFSDRLGNYRTSFESQAQDIWVSADHLPAGAIVDLFLVGDRSDWQDGDDVIDVTGAQGSAQKERIVLAPGATSFSARVWPTVLQRTGAFDLVARINDPRTGATTTLRSTDALFHGYEVGLVIEKPAPALVPLATGDIEANLAGRRTGGSKFPTFRRQDVFIRHNSVYVNLDPSEIPPDHPKSKLAMIYVMPSRDAAGWSAQPKLFDVTEGIEVRSLKPGTVAAGILLAWTDPDPVGDGLEFDVVLDFRDSLRLSPPGAGAPGSPPPSLPPTNSLFDGEYTPGFDIIDSLDGKALVVVSDPAGLGPFPVGRTDYDFIDAYDIPYGQYQDQNVDVRAVVAYPGATAGSNVAVYGTTRRFPVVLILHGNHNVCMSGACTCSSGRIPNHKGYDYLLDLWASHGFIAISIDAYDITACPTDRFIERGALMLEHLRYWTDWDNPAVPDATYGGRFYDRLDLNHVGFAGHSRGGEGVAAAVQINQDLALGYNIAAAILIAPTDYNWSTPPGGGPVVFVMDDTPTFNIMGSSDGDVIDNDGAQLYDRAAPSGHRATKSQAFVYGADHNSWNTVWIDPAWNGGSDGVGGGRITAQQQQDTGRVYMTSWWMAWLQGRREMLAFHRDTIQSPLLPAVETHWNYEPGERLDVDDFEQTPADVFTNSLGGAVTVAPTPLTFIESGFRPGNYNGSFKHDTSGMIVGWNQVTTYESAIPVAWQDVSGYAFISVRTAQIWDSKVLNPGGSQNFTVELEDANGVRQRLGVEARAFTTIPLGYSHPWTGRKSMLNSVMVPLRAFTQENSGLDLTKISKVVFDFSNTGLLAFDNVQFTK